MSHTFFSPRIIFPAVLLVTLLSGCEQETREVSWYKENHAERTKRVNECKARQEKLGKTQDCLNARQAQREMLNSR